MRRILRDKFFLLAIFFISLPGMFNLYAKIEGRVFASAPDMRDAHFDHVVLYMFQHSMDGAAALVINRAYPSDKIKSLPPELQHAKFPIYWGGPVEETTKIMVIEFAPDGKIEVRSWKDRIAEHPELPKDIAANPHQYRVCVGYTGWDAFQFEEERARQGWIVPTSRKSEDVIKRRDDMDPHALWKLIFDAAPKKGAVSSGRMA